MLIKLIKRKGQLTRTFSKQPNYSCSLGRRRSSIRLLIRVSKFSKSAKCHGAEAKCAVQTLVLIQEELAKEEDKNRTRCKY
jgi:hypothetical protein